MSCPQVDKNNEKREFPEDELWDLCQAAYAQYQVEIVNGRKKYHRYVSDFLSFHLPIESNDINDRRVHSRNLSTMYELLSERQDLVELYFTQACFNYELYQRLIEQLNCEGECSQLNYQFNDYADVADLSSSHQRLAYLSSDQISYLTEFFNANDFFSKRLTVEDTTNLFACRLDKPLPSLNNARLAMFLFCLRDEQILVHKWQKVIEDYELISSSKTGLPLKAHNIKNALTQYRRIHGGPDYYLLEVATRLKEMTEKDKKANN